MTVRRLLRRTASFFRRDDETRGLREEMALHVEMRARKLRQSGMGSVDAGYAARRQFGNAAIYQDQISELWGWSMWERFFQDLRHGVRSLSKAPAFTAITVLTLALGLGINTAIFSAVNAVMLRPLPYPHPDRLVSLWEENTKPEQGFSSRGLTVGSAGDSTRTTVAVANMGDYARSGAFEDLAAYDVAQLNLTGLGTPQRVYGEAVTWNYLRVLAVSTAQGRNFLPEEDQEGAARVCILTHGFWQQRLGGAGDAMERAVTLDGNSYRIVGILPAGFQSPAQLGLKTPIEVYVPASYPRDLLQSRGDHEVNVVAQLKSGVSVSAARAALGTVNTALAKQFPDTNGHMRAAIAPLRDDLAGSARYSLWFLLGASGLIVLIACVNVANMLLLRASARRHESSVRMALGSGRLPLIRQLMTESLLVACAGCLAGIALGRMLLKGLAAIAPSGIPRIESAELDWRVFAFCAVLSILTGVIFGMAPAWQASQVQPIEAMKTAARGTGAPSQVRWRSILTIAEVALSLVLLVGAGLLLRSFSTLMGVDLGFRTDRVIAMNVNLPLKSYPTKDARWQFFERLQQRVQALPGVQSVAYANRFPLRGGWSSGIAIDGDPNRLFSPDFQAVSPSYFHTLGIPLLRGRLMSGQDNATALPVAVVNQAFSKQLLDGQDPVGHFIQRAPQAPKITIVGVVNDIRRAGKEDKINPEVYLCAAQTSVYPIQLGDLAVRSAGDPHLLVNAISREVWAIDKDLPLTNVRTMDEIVDLAAAQRRFQTLLVMIFAGVAVALAMIGIYGVLSYSVSQRGPELGIRVALGAPPRAILGLVLRQAGRLIAAGIVLGIVGAGLLTRFLQDLLFQVKTTDWRAYVGAMAVLLLVALAAALIPARRGAKLDPMSALRQE